jgi:hypothetical protein
MAKRKTAGEQSVKARSDTTKHDYLEVGYALTDDIIEQLQICAQAHDKIFDEDEYCLILIVAGDPLIKGIRRHKYAAFLYLPQPRPQQSVFLYNKNTQSMKRLWCMPDAKVMAIISEMKSVAPSWQKTKGWCDAFFDGRFFEHIRAEHGISMLSESEYLDVHRQELIKAGCKEREPTLPDPFDFSKIKIEHIVDTKTARSD